MRSSKIQPLTVLALAVALLVGLAAAPAGAEAIAVPAVNGVHHLAIVDSDGSDWHTALRTERARWDDPVASLAMSVSNAAADTPHGNCASTAGTVRVCVANYTPDIPTGVKWITHRDGLGRLQSVSVMIDASVLKQQVLPNVPLNLSPTWLQAWGGREGLMCAAVGRAIGASGNLCNNAWPTAAALAQLRQQYT